MKSNLFGKSNPYASIVKKSQNLVSDDFDNSKQGFHRQHHSELTNPESVYSYDLDATLGVLKKTALELGNKGSYKFYYICLDRLDILLT